MKKLLITGATGFIGRQCLPRIISKDYEVHAVSLRAQSVFDSHEIVWYSTNLLDPLSARDLIERVRPTHLLHLAWYTAPGRYLEATENLDWLRASIELFRSFAECGGRRAVFAGTCFEYDTRYGYCSEALTPTRPASLYAACKLGLQEVIAQLAKQRDIQVAWARIFYMYGPFEAEQRLIASTIKSLYAGNPISCSEGSQLRDYLHVEEVADALIAVLDSNFRGIVNVGSGRGVSVREIIERLAGIFDGAPPVQWGVVTRPPEDPDVLVADISRLREEIGWRPKIALADGLRETAQWWKNHRSNNAG